MFGLASQGISHDVAGAGFVLCGGSLYHRGIVAAAIAAAAVGLT